MVNKVSAGWEERNPQTLDGPSHISLMYCRVTYVALGIVLKIVPDRKYGDVNHALQPLTQVLEVYSCFEDGLLRDIEVVVCARYVQGLAFSTGNSTPSRVGKLPLRICLLQKLWTDEEPRVVDQLFDLILVGRFAMIFLVLLNGFLTRGEIDPELQTACLYVG